MFTLRTATESDIPEITGLMRTAEAEDGLRPVAGDDDVRMTWDYEDFDPSRHQLVVERDGRLVGRGEIHVRQGYAVALGFVDPPHRGIGIGTALIQRILDTARAEAGVNELFMAVTRERPGGVRLVESFEGFTFARTFFTMLNDSPGAVSEPVWPNGTGLVRLEGDALIDAALDAHSGSFIDHWNYSPLPRSTMETWLKHPDEDPGLWFIAMEGDAVAGFCLCNYEKGPEHTRGWVGELGTKRSHRGIGLGKALLRHACLEFSRRGLDEVGLQVDSDSPTGALGLYEKTGFKVAVEELRYRMKLS